MTDTEQSAETAQMIRAAHPVTETRRCGNRLDEPIDPPPGPPNPPVWCNLPADGHGIDQCRTYSGARLIAFARIGIEVRPPVVTYRCETCRTPQDHKSPTPCATLAILGGGE